MDDICARACGRVLNVLAFDHLYSLRALLELLLLLKLLLLLLFLTDNSFEEDVGGCGADVGADDEDGQWKQHEMEATEAVLDGHEGEVGFGSGQVHLCHVHVRWIDHEKHSAER